MRSDNSSLSQYITFSTSQRSTSPLAYLQQKDEQEIPGKIQSYKYFPFLPSPPPR